MKLSSKNCIVMCWNVWSVLNDVKLENMMQILEDKDVGIACITETWFDTKTGKFSRAIKSHGYELHHAYREDKRGGGAAIIYKKKLMLKEEEASSSHFSSFEYSYVTLTLISKRRLVLICVYRKQEVAFEAFDQEFTTFIDKLMNKGDALLVVGDFNVWIDVEDNPQAIRLRTLMSACGLSQIVTEQTHRDGHTLDHIFVNEFQLEVRHKVIDDTLGLTTDHYPIVMEIPSLNKVDVVKKVSYRRLKDVDLTLFRQELADSLSHLEDQPNFEDIVSQYDKITRAVTDKHAPIIRRTQKSGEATWVDQEYRKNRAKRRKMEKLWKRNRTEEARLDYIAQKKLCCELALAKQTSYYSKLVEDSSNCQKSLFKVANELLDKDKERVLPSHTDPKELANEFNEYYVDKVKKIRQSIPEPATHDNMHYSRPFNGEKLSSFKPTTDNELGSIIKESGIKTSMEDPIPAKLLQSSLDIVLPVYTKLINKSLSDGNIEGLKWSVIDPLLKKAGLETEENKNYRPVNNMVFLSKLTERVVVGQLDGHMTRNGLHEPSQFAYKKFHNTEAMMRGMMDEILLGFDNNLATVVIFLDLSAAFDTIDIDKLIQILHDEIGVDGVALEWFRSYLTHRTQQVKIDGEYSESLEVPCGVPQGSVLGPKLFNINVRSQPLVFGHCQFSSSSFADDSNGRRSFALTFQFQILNNEINNCMKHIISWNNAHFMKINPDKTEIMLYRPPGLEKEVIIKGVIIENQCIFFSNLAKNVGVWLDVHMTMDKHINSVVSHCYKILKDIGRIKKCLQKKHLETLVHAVTSNRLDYCNSLFININKDNIYKLQKVQNVAARLILGKRRRDSAKLALYELHWLNVNTRITFKILLLVYKVLKGKCSENLPLPYKKFNGRRDDLLKLETPSFKTKYGKRIFAHDGSRLWNALPVEMRIENDIDEFKKLLKTLLFREHDEFRSKAFKYNC